MGDRWNLAWCVRRFAGVELLKGFGRRAKLRTTRKDVGARTPNEQGGFPNAVLYIYQANTSKDRSGLMLFSSGGILYCISCANGTVYAHSGHFQLEPVYCV